MVLNNEAVEKVSSCHCEEGEARRSNLTDKIASGARHPRNDNGGVQNPKIILVGDTQDISIVKSIETSLKFPVLNLCDRLTLIQLAILLKKAALVVTNDSAVLHLASYQNAPVAAIFGPTDEYRYGPWSSLSAIVKKEIFCRPCKKAQCHYGAISCMSLIKPRDVLIKIKGMFLNIMVLPGLAQEEVIEGLIVLQFIIVYCISVQPMGMYLHMMALLGQQR